MKKLLILTALLLVSMFLLQADYYIKQKVDVNAMGQQKKQTMETWIGNKKVATLADTTSFIMDQGAKKMYMIVHASKTYSEFDMPIDPSKLMPAGRGQQMAQMMKNMTIKITNTSKTKQIAGFKCQAYEMVVSMEMMGQKVTNNITVWASTEVPFDWKSMVDMQVAMAGMMQMGSGDKFVKEYKKIKGFQLGMDMEMNFGMGKMTMKSEAVEVSKKKAKAGTYTVPAGYTKKSL